MQSFRPQAVRPAIASGRWWAERKIDCHFTVDTPGSLRRLLSRAPNQKSLLRRICPPTPTPHAISWSDGVYDSEVNTGTAVAVAGAVSFTHCEEGFSAPQLF